MLAQKANEIAEKQQRLDAAVENYSIRPKVEADEERLI